MVKKLRRSFKEIILFKRLFKKVKRKKNIEVVREKKSKSILII